MEHEKKQITKGLGYSSVASLMWTSQGPLFFQEFSSEENCYFKMVAANGSLVAKVLVVDHVPKYLLHEEKNAKGYVETGKPPRNY